MKEKILSSLLTVLAFSALQAQTSSVPAMPRLVVGVTIDQLRSDYLEAFAALYGDKGFKRLFSEGKTYSNVSYAFRHLDRASALAAIYTGTSPFKNGIVAQQWLERTALRPVYCVDDNNFIGYYTAACTSPQHLLVSTLTDELEMATKGKSLVYAISPYRDAAIMAAGHAGDGACWLDDVTGDWAATSYYGDCPKWLEKYNDNDGADVRINDLQWVPMLSKDKYDNPVGESSFNYGFVGERRYRKLKASPCVNNEVNHVVKALLYDSMLGADPVTDFLSVTYNAGSYYKESMRESYLEMQDTYVRLDRDIASLLELIEKKVGLQNTLFFLTSTGYVEHPVREYADYRIPTGEFHMNRATALLNMYLMALYGEGQYVEAYHGLQIYIDHKLLEKKQLSLKDILEKSAEFLAELSGVQKVYTSHDFLLGGMSAEYEMARNSYNGNRSGDLIVEVKAGWSLLDAESKNVKQVHDGQISFPLIFMGPGIVPEKVDTPITTDCIAPTLTSLMRIRAPNGCAETPAPGIFK